MTIVLIAAVVSYLFAAGLLIHTVHHDMLKTRRSWLAPACSGVVLHAAYHLMIAKQNPGGADLHFFSALSLVSLGIAAITLIVSIKGRAAALGVVVFPLAAIFLSVYHLHGHAPSPQLDWRLQLHAWMALMAYATLGIAALLAIMLWAQERALRRHEFHSWLRALPPLTELESLLFRIIGGGFALLTITLLTGALFVQNLFSQHLLHKTVLSIMSWLVFGILLLGRWRYGWRGTKAVHWTLAAMILLVLAFTGSKFVLELILQRP
ncbi:MAG: cytochrome c biogenesis protein CcsA [Xanthomonadaceae bacterium]|jgi:ABC-type uncharacterized transport system permease subunit|nr:cytochrome c biogenesis protein CcsA [Xanthomonadaceae bacterium]